jgi:hypothetical protein
MTLPAEETGEKSLLSLIEERTRRAASTRPSIEARDTTLSDETDNVEDDRPGFDHRIMRLGGNGF